MRKWQSIFDLGDMLNLIVDEENEPGMVTQVTFNSERPLYRICWPNAKETFHAEYELERSTKNINKE